MRCLRCAIDYEPDERFCRRCGRALSRIPGSSDPVGQGTFSAADETAFLYSTHAPPEVPGSVAEAGGQQPAAETETYLPADRYGSIGDEDHAWQEQSGTYGGVRAAQEGQQPSSVYIVPPTDQAEDAPVSHLLAPVDDPEDVLTAFRIKPVSIGGEMPRRRRGAAPGPTRAVPARLLLVAALVLIVAVIGGGAALVRHNAFSGDLTAAQQLEAAGRLDAADARYTKAAGEWPFHSAADAGIAGILATVTTRQATATAAADLAAARATAVVARAQIFQAHLAVRQLDAQQQDANVYATATAQAQEQAAAVAQGTAAARVQATAAARR